MTGHRSISEEQVVQMSKRHCTSSLVYNSVEFYRWLRLEPTDGIARCYPFDCSTDSHHPSHLLGYGTRCSFSRYSCGCGLQAVDVDDVKVRILLGYLALTGL